MRERLLGKTIDAVLAHPGRTLVIALLLAVVAGAMIPGLRVSAGHSSMSNPDAPYQQRLDGFLERFGSPNQLVILVEGGDEEGRREVVVQLTGELPAPNPDTPADCEPEIGPHAPGCVRDVFGQVDLDAMGGAALYYLEPDELDRMVEALASEGLGLQKLLEIDGLAALFSAMAEEIELQSEADPPEGDDRKQAEEVMDGIARFFDELTARARSDARAAEPLESSMMGEVDRRDVDEAGFLSSPDGTIKLAIVRPMDDSDEPAVVVPFVDYVDHVAAAVLAEVGARCLPEGACDGGPLRVRLTGLPAIVRDEAHSITTSLQKTTTVAIVGILLLFIFGFGSIRLGVTGLTPMVLGLLLTLAVVRFTYGELNLITSSFIAIILGLGIDFAVHLLARFWEAREAGESYEDAIRTSIMRAGPGILTGAFTTSGAFVALLASDFRGFSELGVMAGLGMVFILLATFTVFPALLVEPRLKFLQVDAAPKAAWLGRFLQAGPTVVTRYPVTVIIVALVVAGASVTSGTRVSWSYDYLDMMPEGLDSAEAMMTLAERTDYSAEVAAVEVATLEEARALALKLKGRETVRRVESLSDYIPVDRDARREKILKIAPLLGDGEVAAEGAVDVNAIIKAVTALSDAIEDAQFEAKRGGSKEDAALLDPPLMAVRRLKAALAPTAALAPDAAIAARLGKIQGQFIDGRNRLVGILKDAAKGEPLTLDSLADRMPRGLVERFYNAEEHALAVYIYPAKPIWDQNFLRAFIQDLEAVTPDATGFAVSHWYMMSAVEEGFRLASLVAVILLIFLVSLDFRSLRYTALAIVPLAVGMSWMWGCMELAGMSYNPGNIIAFPLILGIAVDSGVHILHRFRQQGERDVFGVVRHTGLAVLLSATTTMIGFGSLSLASHRGAASLGVVLLFGVSACLISSTIVLPAMLQVMVRRREASDRAAAGEA